MKGRLVLAAAAVLLLLLLLQPATASEPTAAAARTRRPFMGCASISGIPHDVGVILCALCTGRRYAGRSVAAGRSRVSTLYSSTLNTPSPMAEFVPMIKPLLFRPRQGDYCETGWQL